MPDFDFEESEEINPSELSESERHEIEKKLQEARGKVYPTAANMLDMVTRSFLPSILFYF